MVVFKHKQVDSKLLKSLIMEAHASIEFWWIEYKIWKTLVQ